MGNVQMTDQSAAVTEFDVTSLATITTWTTFGPTGSGADNIISDIDAAVAAGAKAIIFTLSMIVSSNSTGTANTTLWGAVGDVTPIGITGSTEIGIIRLDHNVASGNNEYVTQVTIPLGADNTFQLYWNTANSDANAIAMNYRGFIADSRAPQPDYFPGNVVQTVHTEDGEYASTTTLMVNDDTIPQITEGAEFISASITPTNASNKLKIEVSVLLSSSSTNERTSGALFQDSTADAIAAMVCNYDGNVALTPQPLNFTHWMTAGTTSSTTFSLRAGPIVAGTCGFNGWNSTRIFGGKMASTITITEYQS